MNSAHKKRLRKIFTELKKLQSVNVINERTIIHKKNGTMFKYNDEWDIYIPEGKAYGSEKREAQQLELAEAEDLLQGLMRASEPHY